MVGSPDTFVHAGRRRLHAAATLVVLFALAIAQCVHAQTADVLDRNATIHVTVAGEADVTGDYVVDANGDINMLYINTVHVQGMTVEAVRAKLTQQLSNYIKNPQVLVRLVSPGGISIEIDGAVSGQGAHIVRSDSTLNDVLQPAVPALDADLTKIQITRGLPDTPHTVMTVDYLSFLTTKTGPGNPALQDGDVIFVPLKQIPITVNVRGSVVKPGRVSLPAKSTVLDALQGTGGLTPDANKLGISVQHADSADKLHYDYAAATENPSDSIINPVLLDGDSVIVDALPAPAVYSITGGVLHPAQYPLTTKTSLADAIGIAGGTTDHAHLERIVIVRSDPDTHTAQVIKLDATSPSVQGSTFLVAGDDVTIPPGQAPTRYDPLTILSVLGTIATLYLVFHH